jgi:hypothetical protein
MVHASPRVTPTIGGQWTTHADERSGGPFHRGDSHRRAFIRRLDNQVYVGALDIIAASMHRLDCAYFRV